MESPSEQEQFIDEAETWVCFQCVGEPSLKAQIQKSGAQPCNYCGKLAPAWTFLDVASAIFSVIEEHYQLVRSESPFYLEEGEGVADVIAIVADLSDDKLIDDVREQCEDLATTGMDDFDIPDSGPYAEDSEYAETPIDTYVWSQKWRDFETILKERTRFFSDEAKKILEDIFADIETLISNEGDSVLTRIGPGTEIPELFRARNFYDVDKLTGALGSPDQDLGPPPSSCASGGRMNAQGVSLFYGADAPEVCLAEVRPPVGSWVAMATFELIRPLNLLNLQLLQKLEHPKGSLFDPGYSHKLTKYKFLRTLTDLISRPVMPHDENSDYLTTQAVADFLSMYNKTNVDGIIFPSVQSPDKGRNIVLFHKASLVEKRELPRGTDIYCQSTSFEDDQWLFDFHVLESLPEELQDEKPTPIHWLEAFDSHPHYFQRKQIKSRDPTLRVNTGTVMVHQIEAASFSVKTYSVERTQTSKSGG